MNPVQSSMVRRAFILVSSVVYGMVLLVGGGLLTGGGHAALVLWPLALGPVAHVPAHFSSAFHTPGSSLLLYAPTFDSMISLIAILGWPLVVGLALWEARRCFQVMMALYYLSVAASWMWLHFDSPGFLFKVLPGWHLIGVVTWVVIFIGGQVGLWALHRGWLSFRAEPCAPPNGGPATCVDTSNAPGGPPSVS